jgi:alkylhydroperoxidase family enzyme
MQAGADEAKVREIPTWRESRRFTDAERVALEYAEAMTITGQRVSDELFARLKGSFDEAQIVELTAAVALENFRSKANVALQVQAQGFCPLPGLQNAADSGSPSIGSATQAQPEDPT